MWDGVRGRLDQRDAAECSLVEGEVLCSRATPFLLRGGVQSWACFFSERLKVPLQQAATSCRRPCANLQPLPCNPAPSRPLSIPVLHANRSVPHVTTLQVSPRVSGLGAGEQGGANGASRSRGADQHPFPPQRCGSGVGQQPPVPDWSTTP